MNYTGLKAPVGYQDPRTNSYQVQYIDVGWKIDAKLNEVKPGLWLVECRAEHGAMAPGAQPLPEQDVFCFHSVALLKPGQVAVMASARGRISPQYIKKVLPKEQFGDGDTVLFALSVRRP